MGACVRLAHAAIDAAGWSGEVVVVDNGSRDRSVQVAEEAGARVVHERRRGYGRALRTGFEAARGDVLVMADADGTYDLANLAELVRPVLDDEADMVIATRLQGSAAGAMPLLHRYVGTPSITFLTSRACGRKLTTDSQSGFRAFRRSDLDVLGLAGDGMELASEMLIKAGRSGLRLVDHPLPYDERVGQSKLNTWSDGWRHLMVILGLAPDLLLVWPGALVSVVGACFLALAFLHPSGIEVGSTQWQPIFLAGVALVMGVQAMVAGIVISIESPVARRAERPRLRRIIEPLPVKAFAVGVSMVGAGLLVDLGLVLSWLDGPEASPTTGARLGFATLASTLLILGGTFATFGVVLRFVRSQESGAPLEPARAEREETS